MFIKVFNSVIVVIPYSSELYNNCEYINTYSNTPLKRKKKEFVEHN